MCTGHEEYFAAHQLFFSAGVLFIIVFDLSRCDLSSGSTRLPWMIEQWIRSIQCQDSAARVVLIGTKIDKLSKHQSSQILEFMTRLESLILEHQEHDTTFPQCIGSVAVSGTQGTNVEQLKKIIAGGCF